jgi:hypothetical protein
MLYLHQNRAILCRQPEEKNWMAFPEREDLVIEPVV